MAHFEKLLFGSGGNLQSQQYDSSNIAQVIKKHIYLPGAKSNDPLHIVYVPNVFKFTKISAKGTQESLKWYEQSQKCRRRTTVTTSKIFTAPYICNNLRMASLQNFHFFIMCRFSLATQSYYFSIFKILTANLDRKCFDFQISILFMKGSQGITTDIKICFINYEIIKTHMIKTN